MPNGSDRNWVRFCAAVEGFRHRYGEWPTRVRIEKGYIDDLEHILGNEGLQRVREHLELRVTRGAHFVAEDDIGRSYDYSKEGFPPAEVRPSAVEWLGVDSEHSW